MADTTSATTNAEGITSAAAPGWVQPVPPGGFETVKGFVSRWSNEMSDALQQSEIDQGFFDSKQWTDDELAVLNDRGQPAIVANRIKPAVNGIVGVIEKGRTDPKAWPRTPSDDDSANLATDCLRYSSDANRMNALKSASLGEELIWGWTASITEVDRKNITKTTRIRPEEFIWDPSSRERDLTDALFLGIGKWRYIDDVVKDYPHVPAEELKDSLSTGPGDTPATAQDRPDIWADRQTNRIFLVELYYRIQGVWQHAVFTRSVCLVAGASEYVEMDENGQPSEPRCPIEGVRAYVDRQNRPYGIVRDMRDPQRELNMRRSRILYELASRQFLVEEGVIADEKKFKREASRADGLPTVLPGMLRNGGIQALDRSDKVQFQLDLLAESKAEIERQGPNPGVLGRDNQGQSGRAILATAQAGLLELAQVLGWFEDYVLRIYRQQWRCYQQYGTPEDFIRITDDAGAPQFRRTWVPVPVQPGMAGPAGAAAPQGLTGGLGAAGGQQMPTGASPAPGSPAAAPQMQMVNRLAMLDVDIVIDSSPDVAVIEEEQFQKFTDALPIILQAAPELRIDVIKGWVQASSFRNKADMLRDLTGAGQPNPQQQALQQAQQQLTMQNAQATIDKTKSETVKNLATAKKYQAETIGHAADAQHTLVETSDLARGAAREEGGEHEGAADRRHQLGMFLLQAQENEAERQFQADQAARAQQASDAATATGE